MPAIMLMSIWQAVGFHMVIWLAGLQTIPQELYEAAAIDGTNTWQRFWNVTWPGLQPTMVFVVVTETIGALGVFAQINIMTDGGPLDSTRRSSSTQCGWHPTSRTSVTGAAVSLVFFLDGARHLAPPDDMWRAIKEAEHDHGPFGATSNPDPDSEPDPGAGPASPRITAHSLATGFTCRMTLLALFFLFPIVFMLVSSLKADPQIFSDLTGPRAFSPSAR